jgi:hypothetical protein
MITFEANSIQILAIRIRGGFVENADEWPKLSFTRQVAVFRGFSRGAKSARRRRPA